MLELEFVSPGPARLTREVNNRKFTKQFVSFFALHTYIYLLYILYKSTVHFVQFVQFVHILGFKFVFLLAFQIFALPRVGKQVWLAFLILKATLIEWYN